MNHAAMARTRSITSPSGIVLLVMCLILAFAVSGCASLLPRGTRPTSAPPSDGSSSVAPDLTRETAAVDEHDPWQPFNDKAFAFNRRLAKYALRPVAQGWKAVVPERTEIMMSNAFENITVVPRVLNNALQAQWDGAGRELGRVLSFMDPLTVRDGVSSTTACFTRTVPCATPTCSAART